MPFSGTFSNLDLESLESRAKIEIHHIGSFHKGIVIKTLTFEKYVFLSDSVSFITILKENEISENINLFQESTFKPVCVYSILVLVSSGNISRVSWFIEAR